MHLPREAQIWLAPYVLDRLKHAIQPSPQRSVRVWLAIADHFEPFWKCADLPTARNRVAAWTHAWPEIAENVAPDSTGRPPVYTFFYPEEEYHSELLDALAAMVRRGIADVEIHIHHDNEGRQNFIDRIATFCQRLHNGHGLLRRSDGRISFGFIHGNWALDNSLPGGSWCGLNDEITILRDLGCYADFTMPSGASPSQARILNAIYWCVDDPNAPKSYDSGFPVGVGDGEHGDLLMITGPFGIRWRGRFKPRIEIGELAAYDPATPYRVHRWFDFAPRIGRDIFIKLFAHGAQERNAAALLKGGLQRLFSLVAAECNSRAAELHFVSTWEMNLAIRALCRGNDPLNLASRVDPRGFPIAIAEDKLLY